MARKKIQLEVGKPGEVPPAKAASFLRGEKPAAGGPTASGQDASAPGERTRKKGIVTRADGEEKRRITGYLAPAEFKRLALYCLEQGVDISEVVAEAVRRHLDEKGA